MVTGCQARKRGNRVLIHKLTDQTWPVLPQQAQQRSDHCLHCKALICKAWQICFWTWATSASNPVWMSQENSCDEHLSTCKTCHCSCAFYHSTMHVHRHSSSKTKHVCTACVLQLSFADTKALQAKYWSQIASTSCKMSTALQSTANMTFSATLW